LGISEDERCEDHHDDGAIEGGWLVHVGYLKERICEREKWESHVSVYENQCHLLCMIGNKVLLNLRERGSKRDLVVAVDVLAGLGIRCMLMMESNARCGILLYATTSRERMLKKGGGGFCGPWRNRESIQKMRHYC
jgi:hypothetical protein